MKKMIFYELDESPENCERRLNEFLEELQTDDGHTLLEIKYHYYGDSDIGNRGIVSVVYETSE